MLGIVHNKLYYLSYMLCDIARYWSSTKDVFLSKIFAHVLVTVVSDEHVSSARISYRVVSKNSSARISYLVVSKN